jgi:2TM domain
MTPNVMKSNTELTGPKRSMNLRMKATVTDTSLACGFVHTRISAQLRDVPNVPAPEDLFPGCRDVEESDPEPESLGGWAMSIDNVDREQELRDKAVRRLKKQRDFRSHLLVYVLVNTFLVVIWALTDPHGFFWPVFPIAGWGIGVIMNAWDVYGRQEITEQDIHREMDHLSK